LAICAIFRDQVKKGEKKLKKRFRVEEKDWNMNWRSDDMNWWSVPSSAIRCVLCMCVCYTRGCILSCMRIMMDVTHSVCDSLYMYNTFGMSQIIHVTHLVCHELCMWHILYVTRYICRHMRRCGMYMYTHIYIYIYIHIYVYANILRVCTLYTRDLYLRACQYIGFF